MSDNYEDVGLAGEWEFGAFSGLFPKTKVGGDGGIDFELPVVFTVDVKTSKKGDYLLIEEGKVKADIYVLAHYNETATQEGDSDSYITSAKTSLLGWAFATHVKSVAARDTGRGIINHAIPVKELRPMDELAKMMGRFKRGG